jgi:hypothetical protein
MARETKAQRLAREATEREAQEATMAAEYLPRLMAALEKATREGFEITVKVGLFVVREFGKVNLYRDLALAPTFSWDNFYDLEELEQTLGSIEDARLEEVRQREIRRAAFLKLNEEERTALGLSSEFNW